MKVALCGGVYAATVPLLTDAVDIDVMIVGIKFFLADGDALFRGADVDGVLVFIVCHKKSSDFRFLETEDSGFGCKKGAEN